MIPQKGTKYLAKKSKRYYVYVFQYINSSGGYTYNVYRASDTFKTFYLMYSELVEKKRLEELINDGSHFCFGKIPFSEVKKAKEKYPEEFL